MSPVRACSLTRSSHNLHACCHRCSACFTCFSTCFFDEPPVLFILLYLQKVSALLQCYALSALNKVVVCAFSAPISAGAGDTDWSTNGFIVNRLRSGRGNGVRVRCYSTLLLESTQATEIQHHIYINNSIPCCPPPQRKFTLPELRCSLFPSLATNRVPRLL